ncbi:hypothetical protein DDI_0352 [Dickeya dianthicola RNS04.9]|nr:hypothetical protein DDI_0352 [Dickeya dianthicola RNS04.9]
MPERKQKFFNYIHLVFLYCGVEENTLRTGGPSAAPLAWSDVRNHELAL